MKKTRLLVVFLMMLSVFVLAACKKITYTVSFETGTEQTIETQIVEENAQATKPADPVKEGYDFAGWYNGEVEYKFDSAVVGNITLTAKWEEKEFTVSFVTGTDEVISAQTIVYKQKATKPADPTKAGYNFAGWYNGEVEYTFAEAVTANVTLTAKWTEIKTYTITFVVEGETVKTEVVEEGKSATLPTAPEVEGKTFASWEGTYTNVTKDETVTAVYVTNLYSVQYMVNGEAYGDVFVVEHGQECEKPEDPEVAGYTFKGWDADVTNVKGDLVVNAQLEAIQYNIQYFNGATEITTLEPKTYTVEDNVALSVYDVENYYFFGWYQSEDLAGDAITAIASGTTGDIKLYALNVAAELNGGVECWTTEIPSGFNAAKGIDSISNLPETFEMDFYKYLSDNNLLTAEGIHADWQAPSWAVFSGVNPQHSGDPQRIWNDTSTQTAQGADGYVSLFLYETIELSADITVQNVTGGFLGTEPYKTKYKGLLDHLVMMSYSKYGANNVGNTAKNKALIGFVLDGYFYGTQGAGSGGYFTAARNAIPGTKFGYKVSGETIEKVEYAKTLPTPVKDGYVFAGWYLDAEFTKPLKDNKATALCTLYAKWETLQ